MTPSDAELVRRARGGDRDAFAALVDRHHATLVRCCRRLAGPDLALDAAQDAVVTALLSLDRLRRPDSFGAWLVGIGLNACRALLRAPAALAAADEAPRDPAEIVEERELAARVRAAIAELPSGQRAAVTLYYLAGLTQAEAAAHLGIPPGAVKARLHKARASLRVRLRPIAKETTMVQMEVTDVRRAGDKHILMLAGHGQELKIWIGPPEASSIAVLLENVELPRPTTHHLTAALLTAGGQGVREVRVTRLSEHTFYGEVVLADGTAVDARPSDAIALALVTGAPLLVDGAVLEEAAKPDPEWEHEHAAADAATDDRRVLADEARRRVSPRP
jgi:RNA polymerase sigma factor (sigma-70 family)